MVGPQPDLNKSGFEVILAGAVFFSGKRQCGIVEVLTAPSVFSSIGG